MYGATWTPVTRPDDDQFYCVMIVAGEPVGEKAPGTGTFDEMCAKAGRILANKPYVTQIHVNHRGNFWHRVTR